MNETKSTKTRGAQDKTETIEESDEDIALGMARTVMRPSVQAAVTLKKYGAHFGDLDLGGLIESLTEQIGISAEGDLGRPEAMLIAQAHSLDAIFNNLARRASLNMDEYLPTCETYLKLALKAQAQCRATLEALVELKQPRSVAFVGQANIAQGHQQVNNMASRTGESKNPQNNLLEEKDGEWLDPGATGAASEIDTPLETVGAVDRPDNGGRQVPGSAERL